MWDETGEAINYLWGMSAPAEQLLHAYVRSELVANLTMFHLLRPIYDVNVFAMLRDGTSTPSPRPTPAPSTSRGAAAAPSACTCG